MELKRLVAEELARSLGLLRPAEYEELLELPPNEQLGDYALPCFRLAKELKRPPAVIAGGLAGKVGREGIISEASPAGPYLNLFIKKEERARLVIRAIRDGSFWGYKREGKRVLIEYPSPNTNKPLHVGHVRNMVLGSTVSILLSRQGNKVFQVSLNNDRGIHICQSMLAYQRWGGGREPDKKPDHFVGDFYVKYHEEAKRDPGLAEEARRMLQEWERGKEEVRALWRKMRDWALQGFRETYERYKVGFDKEYFESEVYEEGKRLVLERLDRFERDENGAVYARLGKYHLPDKVLLRTDGTTLYVTQDLAFTLRKEADFSPDLQVWVVASEQDLYFRQLFAILNLLGYETERFHHLSYGMVSLPEGKMKSREGRVVDADELLDRLEELAASEIRKRRAEWSEDRVREVGASVALAAIRFFMLKYDPRKEFLFDLGRSISFEGDTGPYLQYTHARICSVLRKAGARGGSAEEKGDPSLLTTREEQSLLKELSFLSPAFHEAARSYKPNLLAQQLLSVARAFNTFYHQHPVLKAGGGLREARLLLLSATRRALGEALELLGITPLEEM